MIMKRLRFPVLKGAGRVVLALLVAIGVWALVACGGGSKNGTDEPGTFVFDSGNMVEVAGDGVLAIGLWEGVSDFLGLIVELLEPDQAMDALNGDLRLTPLQMTQPLPCITGSATLTYDDVLADNTKATLSFEKCKIDPDPEYFILDGELVLRVGSYNAEPEPGAPFLQGSLAIDVSFDEFLDGERAQASLKTGATRTVPLQAFRQTDSVAFQYGLGLPDVLLTIQETEPRQAKLEFGCFNVRINAIEEDGDLRLSRTDGYSAIVADNLGFSVSGALDFEMFQGEPVPRDGGLEYRSDLGRGPCPAVRAPEGITPAPTAMRLFPAPEAPFMVLELYPNGFSQPKDHASEKVINWFDID
jgi:hypothetical protein